MVSNTSLLLYSLCAQVSHNHHPPLCLTRKCNPTFNLHSTWISHFDIIPIKHTNLTSLIWRNVQCQNLSWQLYWKLCKFGLNLNLNNMISVKHLQAPCLVKVSEERSWLQLRVIIVVRHQSWLLVGARSKLSNICSNEQFSELIHPHSLNILKPHVTFIHTAGWGLCLITTKTGCFRQLNN